MARVRGSRYLQCSLPGRLLERDQRCRHPRARPHRQRHHWLGGRDLHPGELQRGTGGFDNGERQRHGVLKPVFFALLGMEIADLAFASNQPTNFCSVAACSCCGSRISCCTHSAIAYVLLHPPP